MPTNPNRKSQGGDVEGETPIDVSQGEAIDIAKASLDPGYPVENSLGYAPKADLIRGYCDYGRVIGEDDGSFMEETGTKTTKGGHRKKVDETYS